MPMAVKVTGDGTAGAHGTRRAFEAPSVRIVDADEFMPCVLGMLADGARVPLLVSGNSMAPFLRDGRDTVIISALHRERRLHRGDIAFFTRPDGSYVMHRVIRTDGAGVYFIGDAQSVTEGPVPRERVVAAVDTVIRRGRTVRRSSATWRFFSDVRTLRPLIMPPYRLYCRLRCFFVNSDTQRHVTPKEGK